MKITCKICGHTTTDGMFRHGITGEVGPMPDGKYVSICPQCGQVRETVVKGGKVRTKAMSIADILEQRRAPLILSMSMKIAFKFMKDHPSHPLVKAAREDFEKIKASLGDDDYAKLKASMEYRQAK